MDTPNRDTLLWIVINVSAIAWSVYFAYGSGRRMFIATIITNLIGLNLILLASIKLRNRRDRFAAKQRPSRK
jgi:hypothetical protein